MLTNDDLLHLSSYLIVGCILLMVFFTMAACALRCCTMRYENIVLTVLVFFDNLACLEPVASLLYFLAMALVAFRCQPSLFYTPCLFCSPVTFLTLNMFGV